MVGSSKAKMFDLRSEFDLPLPSPLLTRHPSLNYDGLDDYVYVDEQGAVVMWPNLGKTPIAWGTPRKVADGVGALPRDIHFADTNGDGKLDYVVVDRVSGAARSWLHGGFRSDNSIAWNSPISFADGPGSVGRSIEITEVSPWWLI